MRRSLLKSKIHRATVTDADVDYEGSITIDRDLMDAADLLPYERVEIYNVSNGERFSTYAIAGARGGGEVVLNGAAAHRARPGQQVIICSYAAYSDAEARALAPSLVYVDAANRIVARKGPGSAGEGAAAPAGALV